MAHISMASSFEMNQSSEVGLQSSNVNRQSTNTGFNNLVSIQQQPRLLSASNHRRTPALQLVPQKARSALRQVSSSVDDLGQKLAWSNRASKGRSFESLHSEISLDSVKPRQSRPKATLNHHAYSVETRGDSTIDSTDQNCLSAQNNCGADIPRLPFPLISLPQAARLQHIRRERGEEDHTDHGSSFMSRVASRTISTISSSTSPRTPLSNSLEAAFGECATKLTPAGGVHYLHQGPPQSPCKHSPSPRCHE